LDQTYDQVEVVVVDDGSTDESLSCLERFGDRIQVIAQPNGGQFTAARSGLRSSSGSIVVFLDADDLLDPDAGARIVDAFRRNPHAGRIQWRLRLIGPDGSDTGQVFPPAEWPLPGGDLSGHVIRRRTYVWPPTSGNAFPRHVAEQVLEAAGSDTRRMGIDLPLAELSPLFGPVVTIPGVAGSYRYHSQNDSVSIRNDWPEFLRARIRETIEGHEAMGRIGRSLGFDVPADPLEALDWAFIAYRVASLRIDPSHHPIEADRCLRLAGRGVVAVLSQPEYPLKARAKRAAWFAAMCLAPKREVARLVERAFGSPFGASAVATVG
jgi:glycosyltransferase involved in cell wall biosynthesis